MKKFNLNETWRFCLQLWRWVAKQVRAGRTDVEILKKEWLKEHDFDDVWSNCFFCEYRKARHCGCDLCPARKVDKAFDCLDSDYHYIYNPVKFFNRLVKLNNIRVGKIKKMKGN